MNKIKNVIFVLVILILISACSNCYAAGINLSSNKTSVNVGESFSITISGIIGRVNIKGNSNISLSPSGSQFVDGELTVSGTAKSAGTGTITVEPEDVVTTGANPEDVTASASKSITINGATATPTPTPKPTATPTPKPTATPTPAAPEFTSASKTVYTAKEDVNLRSSWSTSSSATTVPKGTELRLTGTSNQKVNGYVWYRVTYNGQIKYVSKDLITETKPEEKVEEKSSNVNLKALSIEGVELTPEFDNSITEYSVALNNLEIEKLNITAEPEDTKTTVTIEGNEDLKEGENVVLITAKAEDGTTRIITITVTKSAEEKLGLQSLSINGKKLESFKSDQLEYTISFENADKLEIVAIANKDDATIEILGNENLVEGQNVITINVKSADEKETVTYTIKATKLATLPQEEVKELNIKSIIICSAIALIAIIFIVILVVKYLKNNNNEDYEMLDEEADEAEEFNKENEQIMMDKPEEEIEDTKTEFAEDMDVTEELELQEEDEKYVEEENESYNSKLDDFFNYKYEEKPRRRGKGKHSK